MYESKFVPIATALQQIGSRESMVRALKDGALRAWGRFVTEDRLRPEKRELIPVEPWYDYDLHPDELKLTGLEDLDEDVSRQVAYIDIEIERKGLNRLASMRRPRKKPGKKRYDAWTAIEQELERLVSIRKRDFDDFDGVEDLAKHLRDWYSDSDEHKGDAPEQSTVRKWLAKHEAWRVLIRPRRPT